MRFSTTAAVSIVLSLAWYAGAQQPGTSSSGGGAAPAAPAAQPGAVELAHLPPDDPEARKLLTECVAEIMRMGPVSFSTRYATSGVSMVIDGKADIRYVRNAAAPDNSTFFGKGRLQMPALNTPDFFVWRYVDDKGKLRVAYQDDNAKTVVDRPEGPGPDGKETDGNRQMGLVLRSMLIPALISPAPFADELKASGGNAGTPCVFMPDEKIGEETCKVVKVIFKQGSAERKIWISPTDKLPRKYEQFRNGLSRYWEITDLKKLTGADATDANKVKVPDGYRLDKQDIGGKVDVVDDDKQRMQKVQPPPPMGGPAVGQIAPDWDLKGADGSGLALSSLKGQTVVVTFGGSMFPQSWTNQADFAKSLDGKAVKVVAIACREGDAGRAKKAFEDAHGVGTLLTGGDATAALYNVRGFPSTVVIGPDGKVRAFFESTAKADDVAAATK